MIRVPGQQARSGGTLGSMTTDSFGYLLDSAIAQQSTEPNGFDAGFTSKIASAVRDGDLSAQDVADIAGAIGAASGAAACSSFPIAAPLCATAGGYIAQSVVSFFSSQPSGQFSTPFDSAIAMIKLGFSTNDPDAVRQWFQPIWYEWFDGLVAAMSKPCPSDECSTMVKAKLAPYRELYVQRFIDCLIANDFSGAALSPKNNPLYQCLQDNAPTEADVSWWQKQAGEAVAAFQLGLEARFLGRVDAFAKSIYDGYAPFCQKAQAVKGCEGQLWGKAWDIAYTTLSAQRFPGQNVLTPEAVAKAKRDELEGSVRTAIGYDADFSGVQFPNPFLTTISPDVISNVHTVTTLDPDVVTGLTHSNDDEGMSAGGKVLIGTGVLAALWAGYRLYVKKPVWPF